MPKYSILMQAFDPVLTRLDEAIASLSAQSVEDWELVILGRPSDLVGVGPFTDNRVRTSFSEPDELLPWAINRLLPTLGEWIGTLDANDRLAPDALEKLELGITANPLAQVVYTDEESRNQHGLISKPRIKGAINPLRLRYQEYLRDFSLVRKALLVDAGGFARITSDSPAQDLYLRTLEARGPDAFLNIPHRLYQRHRDHRNPVPALPFDLEAVKLHLARCQIPATVHHHNGTLDIEYRFQNQPTVTVLIIVGDDVSAGIERIHRSQVGPVYRPATFRILHLGSNPGARLDYQALASAFKLEYRQVAGAKVQALNQEAMRCDSELVCFLEADPINDRWLHRLVDHARMPNVGAVGPRLLYSTRLLQPGVLGYRFDGWDWNTGGPDGILTVPHQTAAVSPACMLVDARRFLGLGSFNPALPALYGMDFCLRADVVGFATIQVPSSQAVVDEWPIDAAEQDSFRDLWPGWSDRFHLHQSF